MRVVFVEGGKVVNIAIFEEGADLSAWPGTLVAEDIAGIDWSYDGKTFSPPEGNLIDRQAILARIDAAAETARLKYITPGAGQALTYQEKAAELARYDEDTQPRIADYPLLGAEIGITADSLKGVADAVRAALGAWRQAGAAIEHVRLKAKADVEKARDDKAVQAVIDAIKWP